MKSAAFAATLLLLCSSAYGSSRNLAQTTPTQAPTTSSYTSGQPSCTPGNVLLTQPLGGFYGHGMHQSLGCPTSQIITSITLGTSATTPAVLSSISFNCSATAFNGPAYPTTKNFTVPIANGTSNFTSLTSADGFSVASVYTSNTTNPGSTITPFLLNPITEFTIGTAAGQNISAGTPGGSILGDSSSLANFNIPSDARIVGFGLFYSTYINGIVMTLICPDLAPASAPVSDVSSAPASGTVASAG